MSSRISRRTGSEVEVLEAHPNGFDADGGKWAAVCWTHSAVVNCDTKKVAVSWLAHSDEWCEDCVGQA